MVNPVLVRRLLDPLDAGTVSQDKHADDLWDWVTENVYLTSGFRALYKAERTKRKANAKAGHAHKGKS
jgi:hypothetical protein